jgi:phospholipid/cholesterol/gamma-HCH transport system substrate-binding protein
MKPSLMDEGENLFASFAEIADKVNHLLDDENQGRVRRTLASLEEVTQRASTVTKKLEPSLEAMPGLIAEAKGLAGDARSSIRKADQFIGSVNGLALKLDERVDTLTRAVASVEEVGSTARAVNDETMPRMNALIDNVSKETRTLGRVINTLGEQPQSIVFGTAPAPPGPGEPGFNGGR